MFENIVTNLYIKILVFLFAKIYKNLQEFTIECNPEDINEEFNPEAGVDKWR